MAELWLRAVDQCPHKLLRCSDRGHPDKTTLDPREAFGAFAHPAQPSDQLPDKLLDPELVDPDIRKVGSWRGADVYIVDAEPSTLCLVIDSNPPWGNAGSAACPYGECAETGTATLWSEDEPEIDTQATVLIPDGATATIERGTFIAAGDGVMCIKPTSPQDGVAVTLTFPDGPTSHFDLKPQ